MVTGKENKSACHAGITMPSIRDTNAHMYYRLIPISPFKKGLIGFSHQGREVPKNPKLVKPTDITIR
jgi:hypothetical protein